MLSFENTQIAFAHKTDLQLRKAYWLFRMVKNPFLVNLGSWILNLAITLRIPLGWALRNTVFEHFCGGETINDCSPTLSQLHKDNIHSVLDYAAEGIQDEKGFDDVTARIIASINLSISQKGIAFAVFKFTGIARFELLEKITNQLNLTKEEALEWERAKHRAHSICQAGVNSDLPVMIDAEETWIQDAIDQLAEELMTTYNKTKPFIYSTLQMYRVDKLFYLKNMVKKSSEIGYKPAFKLVRGAYMEKECKRADRLGYSSPIHPSKDATDAAFNEAVKYCIENSSKMAVCIGTHNENSCKEATNVIHQNGLSGAEPAIYFSQLMGMSDHISYNLAANGYNVAKYVPYGPLRVVMPYLIRRAQENTSVAGQTGRELDLIKKEIKRRRNKKLRK